MIKISVLTSHYGDLGNLRRCIYSVQKDAQNCGHEIEICHNVSMDGLGEALNQSLISIEEVSRLPGVNVEFNSANLGKSLRLNQLLRTTDSDIVMFLDSDDIFLSGKIRCQFEMLQARNSCLVGSGYYPYFRPWQFCDPVIPPRDSDEIATQFIFYPHMLFSTMAIYREKLQVLGDYIAFDETLKGGIDYDFYSRLICEVNFANIQLPLVGYQISPHGITRAKQTRAIQIRTHLSVVRRLLSPNCLLQSFSDFELALCLFNTCVDLDLVEAIESFAQKRSLFSTVILALIEKLNSSEPEVLIDFSALSGLYRINSHEIAARIQSNLSDRLRHA